MLFQELGKLKRSSIMTSIILMAVGIMMIICPPQYIDTLVSALGYGMVTLAVVMTMDFLSSRKVLMNYIYLTGALLLALLGIAVLTLEDIVRVLGIVFGLVLIGIGAISFVRAWFFARRAELRNWWILAVLSCIMIVLGLLVLINPWWKEINQLFDVIGCMLLYSAAVGIVRLIFLWPIKG